MSLLEEIRSRARYALGPVIGVSIVGYFAYHVLQGERGLIAWWQLRQQVAEASALADSLEAERARWEARVHLLRPDSLDPDMLEERARVMLNFGHPNDRVVLTGRHDTNAFPGADAQRPPGVDAPRP